MSEQPDEASAVVHADTRTSMAAVAQLAQRTMKALEQRHREQQAATEQRAAQLRARFDAERAAARASLAPVGRDQWWATVRPEQIASAYETAHAWETFDPDARIAAMSIRDEVRDRYGIDPTSLDWAEELRREAAEDRVEERFDEVAGIEAGLEAAEGAGQRSTAESEHQAASQERSDAMGDSAERRGDTAATLECRASAEAVNVRMGVDTGQGKPAHHAVTHTPQKTAVSRKTKTASKTMKPQRSRQPRA